jgi:hypothetical protein
MKSPEMGIEPRRRKLRKTKSFKDYAEWRNIGHEMFLARVKCNISRNEICNYMKITTTFLRDMELGNRQYSEEWAHKALAYMERK